MQNGSARFGLKAAVGVTVLFFLVNGAVGLIADKLGVWVGLGARQSMMLGLALGQIAALALIWRRERSLGRLPSASWTTAPSSQKVWVAWILTVLGAAVVLSEASNYLEWYWPPPAWYRDAMRPLDDIRGNGIATLVAGALIGPAAEEVIFRLIILGGLTTTRPAWAALGWSAALFGVVHGSPWQGLPAFFLGLLFGWAFLRTGSLLVCVVAHVANNSVALGSSLLPPWIPGLTGPRTLGLPQFQPWWFTLAGALVFAAGMVIFVGGSRRERDP